MRKRPVANRGKGELTLKHVAERAGVSRQAAGAILGDRAHLFREETQERVRLAAKEIGYRPSAAARAILTRRTKQVGVLILNNSQAACTFPHTYYTILGINMALEAAGYVLCMVRIDDLEEEMAGGSRVFREHVLDGIIVTTTIPPRLCYAVEELVPNCIWADTNVWRPTHCVRRDEAKAGESAARAVLAAGYKKILWVGDVDDTESKHYSHSLRAQGVKQVCKEAGAHLSVVGNKWRWQPEMVGQFAPFMRKDVAIIASDIERARLIAKASLALRTVPGEDYGLVCCESVPEVEYGWPDLARVEFDRFALGHTAAEMMLNLLHPAEGADPRATDGPLRSVLLGGRWCAGSTLVDRV